MAQTQMRHEEDMNLCSSELQTPVNKNLQPLVITIDPHVILL